MKHLFSLLVCTVLASAPASTQDTSLTILRAKTLQRLEQIVESAGGTIGVAAIDLTSGEWFTLNETFVFPQASRALRQAPRFPSRRQFEWMLRVLR